jgi:hypothetical protein
MWIRRVLNMCAQPVLSLETALAYYATDETEYGCDQTTQEALSAAKRAMNSDLGYSSLADAYKNEASCSAFLALDAVIRSAGNFEHVPYVLRMNTSNLALHLLRLAVETAPSIYIDITEETANKYPLHFKFEPKQSGVKLSTADIDFLPRARTDLALCFCEQYRPPSLKDAACAYHYLPKDLRYADARLLEWGVRFHASGASLYTKASDKLKESEALALAALQRDPTSYKVVPANVRGTDLYGAYLALEAMRLLSDRTQWAVVYCTLVPESVRATSDSVGRALARVAVRADVTAYRIVPSVHQDTCAKLILRQSDNDHPQAGYLLQYEATAFQKARADVFQLEVNASFVKKERSNEWALHDILYRSKQIRAAWKTNNSAETSQLRRLFSAHLERLLPLLAGFACLFLFDPEKPEYIQWYELVIRKTIKKVKHLQTELGVEFPTVLQTRVQACLDLFEKDLVPFTDPSTSARAHVYKDTKFKKGIFDTRLVPFGFKDYVENTGPRLHFQYETSRSELSRLYFNPKVCLRAPA